MLQIYKNYNDELDDITDTRTSDVIDVGRADRFSIQCVVDVNTPSAKTFDSDTYEVQTLTFDTQANTTHQDFIKVEDAAGLSYAVALTKPVAEVQTLTFDTMANTTHQDFIVVEDTAAVKYAVALTKPVAEVQTLTFPAVAGATAGDYVVLTDGSGLTWAISLDVSGADPEPTGAAWVAVNAARKVHVDISGGTDAASVAALVETDFDALSGSSAIVTDDSAADGTMLLTMAVKAPCANPDPHNADDSGAGSITGVETTAGVASVAPSGPIWTAATHKGLADISGDTTAADVAARAETAFNALTGFTAAITSDDTAADGTMILTQAIKAPVTNPVPKNASEAGAGSITGVETTAGVASVAPSGAIWTAVNAARKGLADISGDTTAAQVAARVETALNALTGFTAAITTDDSAADGTMTLTQVEFGPVVDPVPKNAAESGAGSITGVETTAGHVSEIDLTEDTITIPSHGFMEGLKVRATTDGNLPTGLLTATDYFVIVVDSDTIQLASSLLLAQAGTAIDLTGEGDGQHTLTATALAGASITLQKSNNYDPVTPSSATWDNVAAATSITADANIWFEVSSPAYRWTRLSYTLTAGSLGTDNHVIVKGY